MVDVAVSFHQTSSGILAVVRLVDAHEAVFRCLYVDPGPYADIYRVALKFALARAREPAAFQLALPV